MRWELELRFATITSYSKGRPERSWKMKSSSDIVEPAIVRELARTLSLQKYEEIERLSFFMVRNWIRSNMSLTLDWLPNNRSRDRHNWYKVNVMETRLTWVWISFETDDNVHANNAWSSRRHFWYSRFETTCIDGSPSTLMLWVTVGEGGIKLPSIKHSILQSTIAGWICNFQIT